MTANPTHLDRLANVRDVATADPARLRAGVLYRSEAPQPGDEPPDLVPWPPRTVVDLRSAGELVGAHPLAGPATTVLDVPMMAALAPDADARARSVANPMLVVYLEVLAAAGGWLPALMDAVVRAGAPTLVHCAAGKDRTGIVVALLLALVGVDRPAIEADYARTTAGLDAMHARLDRAAERAGRPPSQHTGIHPDAITAVLDRLGDAPDGFARDHGVPEADLTAWRERIAAR